MSASALKLLATLSCALTLAGTARAESNLSIDDIRKLRARGDVESFERLRDEWLERRSNHKESLEAAISIGGERSVSLIDEALRRGRPDYSASDLSAVINAVNGFSSEEYLDSIEAHVRAWQVEAATVKQVDLGAFDDVDALSRAWAGIYVRIHGMGDDTWSRAAREAEDRGRSPIERSLRLRALAFPGRGPDGPARNFAVRAYRPYLTHPDVELRMAALSVNSALWDWEAVPQLKQLADAARDPWIREKAESLVSRYLAFGPARPGPKESVLSPTWRAKHLSPWDPEGSRAWAQHYLTWREEQSRLLTGRSVDAPMPPRPAAQFFGVSEAETSFRQPKRLSEEELPARPQGR